MWCQATCFLFVIILSSCEPRRIYIDSWYETTSPRLTPRAYSTSGGSNRGYATFSEETEGADALDSRFQPTEVARSTWYDTENYRRVPADERQILQVLLQPDMQRSSAPSLHSVSQSGKIDKNIWGNRNLNTTNVSGGRRHITGSDSEVHPSQEVQRGTSRRSDGSQRQDGQNRKMDIEMRIVTSREPQRRSPAQEGDSAIQHVSRPRPSKPHQQYHPPKQSARPTNRTKQEPNRQPGDIVFPDNQRRSFEPRSDNCPKGSTVCEGPQDGYPANLISRALREHGEIWRGLLGEDVIPEPNVTQRIDLSGENALCPSQVVTINPNQGINKDERWLFIVNQGNHTQGIKIETCQHTKTCELTEGFPLGYETYCKQKYIYRKMLCMKDNGKLEPDEIKIPSCCSCFYKQNFASRMAVLAPQKKMTSATSSRKPPTNK